MYTNGNFEAHLAAGPVPPRDARPDCSACDRKRSAVFHASRLGPMGDEKFYGGLDCHMAYSVGNVRRTKTIGDIRASGEFYVIQVRSHFDKRTIAPK